MPRRVSILSAALLVLLSICQLTTSGGKGLALALQQYTPNQANWTTFETKAIAGSNTAHDPDGVGWIDEKAWKAAEWDGTIYNPSKMTKKDFVAAICPAVDRIRGIREVFYQHKPFANNKKPTIAEIDEWHRIALNHVRTLIGYTSEDRKAKKDHCMFARALWGQERRFTTKWDAEYPGKVGSAYGPCQGSKNAHCGATFLPNATQQRPFLAPLNYTGTCRTQAGSEGVFGGPKSNIPWSLKWSRGLCNTLHAEGFWGGHVGPFFHREKFGFSFWDNDPSNNNNNAVLRAKWTGKLMPNLYCNPAKTGCDPEKTGPDPTTSSTTTTTEATTTNSPATTEVPSTPSSTQNADEGNGEVAVFKGTFNTTATGGGETPPKTEEEFAQMIVKKMALPSAEEVKVISFDGVDGTFEFTFVGESAGALASQASKMSPSDLGVETKEESTTSSAPGISSSSDSGASAGLIALIILSVIVSIVIIALGLFIFLRRKRTTDRSEENADEKSLGDELIMAATPQMEREGSQATNQQQEMLIRARAETEFKIEDSDI